MIAPRPSFLYADLVGRWKLRVTEEFRAFVEDMVRANAPAHAVEAALVEALHEAEGAEIELGADGRFVSRSHGVELLAARFTPPLGALAELVFDKAPGQTVNLRLASPGEVRVLQPGKPEMTFDRVSG